MTFNTIPEILDDIRDGKMVIIIDDADRENEGDLVCAAEKVTPEIINFMAKYKGMICLSLTEQLCHELHLHPQTTESTASLGTAYMVTIDAKDGVGTGISANDRATTIRTAVSDSCKPEDLNRPGHVTPLKARDGGVLVRAGHTEASIDLARMAGLKPAGVISEIMAEDGQAATTEELMVLAEENNLKIARIADLIEYRYVREPLIKRVECVDMPTEYGQFRLIGFKAEHDQKLHLAICKGDVGLIGNDGEVIEQEDTVLIRVHSECMTGDIFGSNRCDCGPQLHEAMKRIEKAGKGAIIYLRQEGRGIGLLNKLHAYHLQDVGMDTVQANVWLGHKADKRDYGVGAQICRELGLKKIANMTNNPTKTSRLEIYGIEVVEQIPIEVGQNEHNEYYLKTKRDKMGHNLNNL